MERPERQPGIPIRHPVDSGPSAFDADPAADPCVDENEEEEASIPGLQHLSPYEQRTYTYCDGTIHILFKDREFTDVVFICEDGSNVEAHKFILAARSEYFKDYCYRKGDNLDENSKIKTYNFPASKLVLEVVLEYLYTGQISEFESSNGVIDEHTLPLWTSVLKQALEKSFGGLDIYMRALLVRCYTSEHHVAASLLTFAMANNLMDVSQAMVDVLLSLPFTDDCFKKMPEEAIEVVLDTVPFQVEETRICQALAEWLKADSMDDDDELGGSTLPPNLERLIDLRAISIADVQNVLNPLQIMDPEKLTEVYIMHALAAGGPKIETTISQTRGARHNWKTGQAPELFDDAAARSTVMNLQQYTTFSGTRPDGTPAPANGRTAQPFETIAE